MYIFPVKERTFKLIDSQKNTLDRLKRRTDKSQYLTSQFTDKSFRGQLNENKFKIISSKIGRGAFCVLTGEINTEKGFVKVEIHTVFKGFLTVFLFLPLIAFFILYFTQKDSSQIIFLVALVQVLLVRYVIIELGFKFLSKKSLNRLRDVLDFEWIN